MVLREVLFVIYISKICTFDYWINMSSIYLKFGLMQRNTNFLVWFHPYGTISYTKNR